MRAAVVAVIAAAALAGCGGDDDQTSSSATAAPPPSATATPSETPTATPTPTPSATEQPSPTATQSPEDQPGGAGDEEAIRVPAEFTVRASGISPPQIAVPAFLTIELAVHNETSKPVVARLQGAEPLTVGAGETGRARIEGRKKGQYVIDMGDAGQALLVTGAKPGP